MQYVVIGLSAIMVLFGMFLTFITARVGLDYGAGPIIMLVFTVLWTFAWTITLGVFVSRVKKNL